MSRIARHLALIPDGNRRWARARQQSPTWGHQAGIARLSPIADRAFSLGVETITFWWGSPSNLLYRDPKEVDGIVRALQAWLSNEAAGLLHRHDAILNVEGRWREICPQITAAAEAAMVASGAGPRRLMILFGYDGRDEILAAADRLNGSGGSRDAFADALWTAPAGPVDLVIRTGAARHLSAGFLLWNIAEAQLVFRDEMWPEMTPDRIEAILHTQARLERRYGR